MGAWGVGLYQCDEAADLKAAFAEAAKLPIDTDALVERLIAAHALRDDPDETDGWLALADQLHRYGLEHEAAFATARKIITSGADLRLKQELEMAPRDLEKRANVLDELLESWAKPHPKPRKRRMMKGPEEFIFEVGDVWIMPAMQGAPLPFFWHQYDQATIGDHYKPDGWAGFVVFDRWLYETFFARYLIAVLHLEPGAKPSPEVIPACTVRSMTSPEHYLNEADELATRPFLLEMVFTTHVDTPRKTLKLWQAEKLTSLKGLDAARLRAGVNNKRKDEYLDERGFASLEHLMTLSSFHHTVGPFAEQGDEFGQMTKMPISRFL